MMIDDVILDHGNRIDTVVDSTLSAMEEVITLLAVPAAGALVFVAEFGGTDCGKGIARLQWGSGNDWETIRAIGFGTHALTIEKIYAADGTKRLRIVRENHGSTEAEIIAWVVGTVIV